MTHNAFYADEVNANRVAVSLVEQVRLTLRIAGYALCPFYHGFDQDLLLDTNKDFGCSVMRHSNLLSASPRPALLSGTSGLDVRRRGTSARTYVYGYISISISRRANCGDGAAPVLPYVPPALFSLLCSPMKSGLGFARACLLPIYPSERWCSPAQPRIWIVFLEEQLQNFCPASGCWGVTHMAQAAAFSPARVVINCRSPLTCEKAVSARRAKSDLEVVQKSLSKVNGTLLFVDDVTREDERLVPPVRRKTPADGQTPSPSPAAGAERLGAQRQADFVTAVRKVYRRRVPAITQGQIFRAEVDAHCTLCVACANVCPERSLHASQTDDSFTLLFSAERCIGCGLCATRCPEKAIRIEPAEDIGDMIAGQATKLFASPVARCRRCKAALGPASSIAHVANLLSSVPAVAETFAHCPSCKIAQLGT